MNFMFLIVMKTKDLRYTVSVTAHTLLLHVPIIMQNSNDTIISTL